MAGITTQGRDLGIGVVECCTEKGQGCMTDAAIPESRYMVIRFAGTYDVVVTRGTTVLVEISRGVVKGTRGETTRDMAGAAILGRRQVADIGLAQNVDTVVTAVATHTGDHGTSMIDKCTHETGRIMTGTAVGAGQ